MSSVQFQQPVVLPGRQLGINRHANAAQRRFAGNRTRVGIITRSPNGDPFVAGRTAISVVLDAPKLWSRKRHVSSSSA